jgi:hypothetical protein
MIRKWGCALSEIYGTPPIDQRKALHVDGHHSHTFAIPMSTEAIRNELIDWISELEDQSLLGSLLGIKKATQHSDWADDLSPEERRSIERGLDDLKNGRMTPSKDFWARHGR